MTALATAYALRDLGYVPHAPAEICGRIVELVSYPTPHPVANDGTFAVLARMTPGDPTTIMWLRIPEEAVDLARVW